MINTFSQLLTGVCSLMVLSWSVVGTQSGLQPVAAGVEAKPLRLVFDQYHVNQGLIPDSIPVVRTWFQCRNLGDQQLKIVKLTPSCGCLAPKLAKEELQPTESTTFQVGITTANTQSGQHDYTIDVEYEVAGKTYREQVSLNAIIPERKVTISPPGIIAYQYNGEETVKEIELIDFRGKGFEVEFVEFDDQLVKIEPVETFTTQTGAPGHRYRATITGDVPSGMHNAPIRFFTDDPNYEVLVVRMHVYGPPSETAAVDSGKTTSEIEPVKFEDVP